VSLRSVTQATRLSRNAITWKRTSIDQVLASPEMSPIMTKTKKSLSISTTIGNESWYGSTASPIARCGSPESMFCTGRCRDDPILRESSGPSADVVGILRQQSSFAYKQADGGWFLNPDFLVFFKRWTAIMGRRTRIVYDPSEFTLCSLDIATSDGDFFAQALIKVLRMLNVD